MTQQDTIDRFARTHGRVEMRDGYADESVRVTVPTGEVYSISPEGVERYTGRNSAVDWSYPDEDYVPPCRLHRVEDCSHVDCQIAYAREGY